MKNYEDLTLRDLHNSSQDTQPHSLIGQFTVVCLVS